MDIWAIADLHLSFGIPSKSMDLFGPVWKNHAEKIAANWKHCVHPDDLVLIAGDISWANTLHEVKPDLEWMHALPGTKVMIKGNHDYWWPSNQKLKDLLPPSIHFIHNSSLHFHGIALGGTRLWETDAYSFDPFIEWKEIKPAKKLSPEESKKIQIENRRIFEKELTRLRSSLTQLSQDAPLKIALTHYPPIGPDLLPSEASQIFEEYHIDYCLFGHLHNVKENMLPFGEKNGISYVLTSCDYLEFAPKKICTFP